MSRAVVRTDALTTAAAAATDVAAAAQRRVRDSKLAEHLAGAARGDGTAFEAFYEATVGYARSLARRVIGQSTSGSADIDDLLADVFFEAWRNAARFDAGRGSAVTWLLTLVHSRALDALRSRAVHPSAGDHAMPEDTPDPAADPSEQLWQQQAGTRLYAALARLTAAERWALGLAYYRELTHREIAAATGWPLGTVKSHLQRAQTKLRTALNAS